MICIIGAGISGLSLAYHLHKKGVEYVVLEASKHAGGCLLSRQEGNYLTEMAANAILCDQEILQLIDDIGLTDDILLPNDISKARFILKGGQYVQLPSSPKELLTSTFFSLRTKLTILGEMMGVRFRSPDNETVSAFFKRHFNEEIVDYAVNPFISGIYAGNPDELLLDKTFPILRDYEKKYGSVLRGLIKNGAKRKQSLSFKNGMQQLVLQLAAKLNIRYEVEVHSVEKYGSRFVIETNKGEVQAKKLVLSLPAPCAREILKVQYPDFADALSNVRYASMAVVHSGFKKHQIKHHLNGFGALNPKKENTFSAGSIWTSSIFADRCPADEVLMTSFVGGTQFQENTQLSDNRLLSRLNAELKKQYKITGEAVYQQVYRWQNAIPQYDLAINAVYKQSKLLESEDLWVCANWKGDVSLADCLKKGKNLADILNRHQK